LNHIEATKALSSGSPHVRLKAARFFARHVQTSDLSALRKARSIETVSYVQNSLDLAITRLSENPAAPPADPVDELAIPEVVRRQIHSQATDRIAGLLLHEIASPIGLLARTASREVPDYETSKTKRHLETLQKIFAAIEQLKGATASPKPEQFDLAQLVDDIVIQESENSNVGVSTLGPKPMLVTSDPTLLRLAVGNGLRNAHEAVLSMEESKMHPIVVTWGETDVDYWIAVLDRGPGLSGPTETAFAIGKTSKQGHSGFGLAIAKQAIDTLDGTVTLRPGVDGGVHYEIRWGR
jgi:signal transduction histidine kinase